MARFFTSDHHFFHKNILKYEASHRPFETIEDMNQELIHTWNRIVRPEDEVYYLGDFAFTCGLDASQKILDQLHGTKYLINGNHDPKGLADLGFEWAVPQHEIVLKDKQGRLSDQLLVNLCHYPYVDHDLSHMRSSEVINFEPSAPRIEEHFDPSLDSVLCTLGDYETQRAFLLRYYGIRISDLQRHDERVLALQTSLKRALKRFTWRRPQSDGRWLIHGHVHSLWKVKPYEKMLNVSVEVWGLEPVSEQSLVEYILSNGVD